MVNKHYGGVQALIDAKFECYEGEVHALIGENGAGKSTMVKILCGVVTPDSGEIKLRGEKISFHSPIDATKHKIASVFQELSLFPDLSVAENIYMGNEPKTRFGTIDFKKMEDLARQLMDELGFNIEVRELVKNLSLESQQLVEIAKAVSKDPDIIILDEATSALGKEGVDLLLKLVKRLTREKNKTIIFISHKMDELEKFADRATIFRDAKFITTFSWGSMSNEEIISNIAGRKISTLFPKREKPLEKEYILEVDGLNYKRLLKNISVKIKKGEIFGLAGLSGQGQEEFLNALFGSIKIDSGSIKINGKKVKINNPRMGLKSSIALTPADRKTDGLLLMRSVGENIALMTLSRRSKFGIINGKKEKHDINKIIDLLKIKVSGSSQLAGTLSGGNQQKTVIGKAILTDSDVLLFSDPTRGIDVGTKHEIYKFIRNLAENGKTVIMYSTENSELLGLCDRIAVFKDGEIAAMLEGTRLTENEIIKAALGFRDAEVSV